MKRHLFLFIVFIGATSFAGSFLVFSQTSDRANRSNKTDMPRQSYRTYKSYRVESGDTWEAITKKLGIEWNVGASILEAAKDIHNLEALREGNEFRFVYDSATNELVGAEYDIDDEDMMVLEKNEIYGDPTSQNSSQSLEIGSLKIPNFEVHEEAIQYEVEPVIKRGVIESSLFETAQKENIPVSVIMEMARIFSWDVDFASSVQPGDTFALLYEERNRIDRNDKTDETNQTDRTDRTNGADKTIPGKILAGKFVNDDRKVYAFYFERGQNSEDYNLSRSDLDKLDIGEYYNEEGRELKRQFLRSPLDYKRITSSFSYNRFHPILQSFTTHRAIDYSAAQGTPVSATADGVVNYAGWKGGNGNFVGIRHENVYETGYAHLSAYAKGIKTGSRVEQNQIIGFVGSTGWSTGPHLHYEMRKNGVLINPLRLDLPPGKMIQEEYKEEFLIKKDELLRMLGV